MAKLRSFFQNPVAADVSRLNHAESRSELIFAAMDLKEPLRTCSPFGTARAEQSLYPVTLRLGLRAVPP